MLKKASIVILGMALSSSFGCVSRGVVVVEQPGPRPAAKNPGQVLASERHLENGKKFLRRGHTRKAIREFQKAIEADPRNWEAQYYLGIAYRDLHEYDHCLDYFHSAIRLHDEPEWVARVRVDIGFVWEMRGNRNRALEEYNLALKVRPDYEDAIQARARLKANKRGEDDKSAHNKTKREQHNKHDDND